MKTVFSQAPNRTISTGEIKITDSFLVVYIEKGSGDFFLGDNVVSYERNDLFFFSGRIAQSFKRNAMEQKTRKYKNTNTVSMVFDAVQMKKTLESIPEAYYIKNFMAYSEYGVRLVCNKKNGVQERVRHIQNTTGLQRMLSLYRMIDHIAKNKKVTVLSAKAALKCNHTNEEPKLKKIFDFIEVNHRDTITLDQIAAIANMSPTGFCRFFKTHRQKTFSQYLAEVRIETSCKMLRDGQYSIADCCYESGFNNLSNFNRHFKKNTGMSPSEYRAIAIKKAAV